MLRSRNASAVSHFATPLCEATALSWEVSTKAFQRKAEVGMPKVAVVGGSGFIGKRLVGTLPAPLVIDRSVEVEGPNSIRADVRDREALARALEGTEVVYLLAAEHADDVQPPSLYHEVNVGGAESVIAAARRHGISRIVFTSTVAIYGLDAPAAPEETEPAPFNEYGRSKWEAERRLEAWAAEDPSRGLVVVRPSVVFGEENRGNVHNLLRQLQAGRFLRVGRGRNRKSMAYVGNLARFLAGFVDAPPGVQVYNYADKPDLSMEELLAIASDELGRSLPRLSVPYPLGLAAGYAFDALARVSGRRFPVSAVRVRKFCADTTVNTDRLEASGFEAPFSLEEGLRRMIRADFSPAGDGEPA